MLHDCVKTWSTREMTRAEDVHLTTMRQSYIDEETTRMTKAQSKSGVVSHGHRPFVDLTAVRTELWLAHPFLCAGTTPRVAKIGPATSNLAAPSHLSKLG